MVRYWCFGLLVICFTFVTDITANTLESADTQYSDISLPRQKANIKVTATGSAILLGNQVLYFEGLGEKEVTWIYDSFLYGGVASSALKNIGFYGVYAALPGNRKLWELLFHGSHLTGIYLYYRYAFSNLKRIWDTGTWYSLPALLSSLSIHKLVSMMGVPAKERHLYMLAATLKGTHILGKTIDQLRSDTTTHYLHVPLSGRAGKQFMVKAIFPDIPQRSPLYEMNRIGLEAPSGDGGYQALAQTLEEQGIDRIYIIPGKSGGNTLTTFFYDNIRERNIKLAVNGDFGSPEHSPWLLNAVHLKQDRQTLYDAQSALSPSVIRVVTDAYKAYFSADQKADLSNSAKLQQVSDNHYFYTPGTSLSGTIKGLEHHYRYSDFDLGTDNEHQAEMQWSHGIVWPGMSVTIHDEDADLSQWWFPEWLSQFLTAEIAGRGRQLGAHAVNTGAAYLSRASGLQSRIDEINLAMMRRLRTRLGLPENTTNTENAAYGEHDRRNRPPRRSWLAHLFRNAWEEFDLVDEIELREELSPYQQPDPDTPNNCIVCQTTDNDMVSMPQCNNHPICLDCLDAWGRAEAGKDWALLQLRSWLIDEPADFSISCPLNCGSSVRARVIHWDPVATPTATTNTGY